MKNKTTEEKILDAARKVFTKNGFAATRTRDIADEAGINVALLNYYFRSKEKLFSMVMEEKINELFGQIIPILADKDLVLEKRLEKIINTYFDLLSQNHDLPFFVLNELNKKSSFPFASYLKNILSRGEISHLIIDEIGVKTSSMIFLLNFIGAIVFPFIARPVFISSEVVDEKEYDKIIEQQRCLVPFIVQSLKDAIEKFEKDDNKNI